jgi:hypothetical protein
VFAELVTSDDILAVPPGDVYRTTPLPGQIHKSQTVSTKGRSTDVHKVEAAWRDHVKSCGTFQQISFKYDIRLSVSVCLCLSKFVWVT